MCKICTRILTKSIVFRKLFRAQLLAIDSAIILNLLQDAAQG